MKIKSFEDLIVWKKSHELVLNIYKLTKNFPEIEKFSLVSQMRRCAISIPANIAEGFKRKGIKDKAHFYNISESSLEELKYFLILSKELEYTENNSEMIKNINEVSKMLNSLIRSIISPS